MRRFDPPRHRIATILGSILFVGAPSLHAVSFDLPTLNSPPSAEHHVGKVVWADLVTPDLSAAEKFYGGLLGWQFQTLHTGDIDYVVATLDGRPIGGLLEKPIGLPQQHQANWLIFIAVLDVDAVKNVAVAHKAKVLIDSHTYGGRGRQAVLADPEGAVFAIVASSTGDPPDLLALPGEWIWSSLHAKDAGTEAAFYQDLFGYDVYDVASTDGKEHLILSTDEVARASANEHPDATDHRHAHWLNFVRVNDANDSAAKAVMLGGRILVTPHADRHGDRVAVVADPAGAPLGLMEWSDTDTKGEPR